MQSSSSLYNNNTVAANASGRPRSPRSLEAGAGDASADAADAAAGFVDVRLSVAVPPSPYRSAFSATGCCTTTKTVDSAQNSPRAAEGGVRIVFTVRKDSRVVR